jgi:two-component system response regulator FixJ
MSENEPVVYLVDDEEAIRKSASFMLRTAGYKVRTFESGIPLLKEIKKLDPGCILLDVRMPEMDGLEIQRGLRDHGIMMPVVIMTGHGDVNVAVRAMKAGAIGFIEKPFEKATLVEAIQEAFHSLAQADHSQRRREEARDRLEVLTARERQVIEGLANGFPNKTIAYDLGISPRTVEVYRANAMSKLGARSLSETLRIAFAAGMGSGNDYSATPADNEPKPRDRTPYR